MAVRQDCLFISVAALSWAVPVSAAWAEAREAAPAADEGEQVTSLDNNAITVTATRAPVTLLEAPATVTVIDAEQIADSLASDVRELVRFEPGVSVRRAPSRFGAAFGSTGRDGNSGFNIRGLDGNRVLTVIDGVRVPDAFSFGAQAAGRGDYVDLGLLRSVEILRGPASALYGSDGLAGMVSFVTADPADFLDGRSLAGMARASYDSADGQWSTTGVLAGETGPFSAMIAYTRREGHELDNKGTNDAPNSTRTRPNPADTRVEAIIGKLAFDMGGAGRLRLTGETLGDSMAVNVLSGRTAGTLAPTSVMNLAANDRIARDRVALDWLLTGSGMIERASLAGYWQDGRNSQRSDEDRNIAPDRLRINTFDNRVIGAAGDLTLRPGVGEDAGRLMFGADISVTRQNGLRDGTVPPMGETFPTRPFPETDFTLAGGFAGAELRLAGGDIILFPALRFDHYRLNPENDPLLPNFTGARSSGSRFSPRMGVTWRVSDTVSLVGNYAQGFKAPTPSQVNQFFENLTSPFASYRTIQNPDLEPETSRAFEAGLRVQDDIFSGSITAFTGTYRNFISQEQIGGTGSIANPIRFQFINLARAEIHGVEARGSLRPADGWTIDAAFAWAKGDSIRNGVRTPLLTIDPLRLVGGVGYRDPGNRFGGQIIATVAASKERGRAAGLCTPSCLIPDGYVLVDATAFVRIADRITLRAGIFNLLDIAYTDWADLRGTAATAANLAVADAFTQPGRNVSVSATISF